MAHPIDFVEGQGQYPSLIKRCAHAVYWIDTKSPNRDCSLCVPAQFQIPSKWLVKKLDKEAPPIKEDYVETKVRDEFDEPDAEKIEVEGEESKWEVEDEEVFVESENDKFAEGFDELTEIAARAEEG